MSKSGQESVSMREILKEFAGILAEHSAKTDKALEKLTGTVEELAKSHIETRKDREHDQLRMERFEDNQKEQGEHIKTISDTVILLDERVGNQKDKWANVTKIIVAVITSIIITAITVKYLK